MQKRLKRIPANHILALSLVFSLVLNVGLLLGPGFTPSGIKSLFASSSPGGFPLYTTEEIAGKPLFCAGWECSKDDHDCTHIFISGSSYTLCIPAKKAEGSLLIPLEHFRLIAGCGLVTSEDGKPVLIYFDQEYHLEAGSPYLICGDKIWTLPVLPEQVYGHLYVPLRFLCEVLGLDIAWHEGAGVVLINSPWVDRESLPVRLSLLNETLLSAIEDDWTSRLEPMDITITFYYSSKIPTYTASGQVAVGGSVAADARFAFGTTFYIPELGFIRDDGIFTVHDRGTAVTGNVLDIFIPQDRRGDPEVLAALRRGRYPVTAYLIRPPR